MKRIKYEIINHGYDHSQYFQGCGTYGTDFEHVATGYGMNAKEAYEDAVEQVAMAGQGPNLPIRPRGINAKDKVPAKIASEELNEIRFYVSIRYNL